MGKSARIVIVMIVVLAGAAALFWDRGEQSEGTQTEIQGNLPLLVDLGSKQCVACKKMAPILDELKQDYAGRMDVVFIDVWQDSLASTEYGIRLIPTQIFYDATGQELFRHEGFLGKEAILSKWSELGIDFSAAATGSEG